MTNVTDKRLIWKCTQCNSVQVSTASKNHSMDFCKCGNIGVDLELYYCREIGQIKDFRILSLNILKNGVWTPVKYNF